METILSIDPSGSGTTGICIADGVVLRFEYFKDSCWENHLWFIVDIIKKNKPTIVLFETTNYIAHKTQSCLDLLKLIGSIVALKYCFDFILLLESIAVNQVKLLKNKLHKKEIQIEGLTCEIGRGKGWKYQSIKINLHQLDAFIIFYLWKKKILIEKEEKIKKLNKKINKEKSKKKVIFL